MYIPVDNIWCESATTKVWPQPDLCIKLLLFFSTPSPHGPSSWDLQKLVVNREKPMRMANFNFSSHLCQGPHHRTITHPRKSFSQAVPQLSPLASSLTSMLSPLLSWTGSFFSSRLRQPHFQASHWKQSKAAQGGAISSGSNSSSGKYHC